MQIRIQAVDWKFGDGITPKQFFQHLETVAPPPLFGDRMGTDFKGRRRLLFTTELAFGKWGVLFVTVKSAKAFLKVCPADGGGGLSFVLHQIDESKERLADFNFLVMNAKTGRGAYAHYHQSCGFDDFTQYCRDEYRQLKEKLMDDAKRAIPGAKKKDEDEIKRKFKGLLQGNPMLTKGDVAKLVKQLAEIDSLELNFTEISVAQQFARPLAGVATLERRIYRLDKKQPLSRLVNAVRETIRLANAEKGRVVGSGDNNLTRIVNLQKNLGVFAELDFKQTVTKESFDVGNLKGSPTLQAMLALLTDPEYEGMFAVQERGRKDVVGDDD
jgi:hypothetical protein